MSAIGCLRGALAAPLLCDCKSAFAGHFLFVLGTTSELRRLWSFDIQKLTRKHMYLVQALSGVNDRPLLTASRNLDARFTVGLDKVG